MNAPDSLSAVRLRAWLVLLLPALGVVAAVAAPPVLPLPAPYYSFDRNSPSVMAGLVSARDVLTLGPAGPVTVVPGPLLGLNSPQDELDCLSGPTANWLVTDPFSILFSVDRASTGLAPANPLLASLGRPFNVRDQAQRGHASGDQFTSTDVYLLFQPPGTRGPGTNNNTLDRNNYDEGGTDFGALPPTSAAQSTPGAAQDRVDAFGEFETTARLGPVQIYFSLARLSPSLLALPGGAQPSGATIFFNPAPLEGTPTELYAFFSQLQLVQNDDIDAMVVFDLNANGTYDALDRVLFSLTPNSPSLQFLPGASTVAPAADVFIARPGAATQAFVNNVELGLGATADNIDALSIFSCATGIDCATAVAIRITRGDINCDGHSDFDDIDPFILALSGPDAYADVFPNCFWLTADANCDGTVNFDDIDAFVACIGAQCACP